MTNFRSHKSLKKVKHYCNFFLKIGNQYHFANFELSKQLNYLQALELNDCDFLDFQLLLFIFNKAKN